MTRLDCGQGNHAADVLRAIKEYDRLGPELAFLCAWIRSYHDYDLVWGQRRYLPKAIWARLSSSPRPAPAW